jgi:hypothetical protein
MARGRIGTMTPSSLMALNMRPSKLSQVSQGSLIFSIIDFTINSGFLLSICLHWVVGAMSVIIPHYFS